MKPTGRKAKTRHHGASAGKGDRTFNITVKLVDTRETFPVKNIHNDMKISELLVLVEYATGIPVHMQRLQYLDEGDLMPHTDVRANDMVPGATLTLRVWNMWRTLVEATAANDADMLFKLGITQGTDYKTPNSDYMSVSARKSWFADRAGVALYIASHRGHQKLCDKLIQAGADVNAKTNSGRTALHVASAQGRGKIVDLLLEKGADINAADDSGETALSVATKFGHKSCERHLFLFRWQERAKETSTKTEHEMFAHQYFDSTNPVWLKGDTSQIYYMQIVPPGEYSGTSLSAPARKPVEFPHRATLSAREEESPISMDFAGDRGAAMPINDAHKMDVKSRQPAMAAISEGPEGSPSSGPDSPHKARLASHGGKGEPASSAKAIGFSSEDEDGQRVLVEKDAKERIKSFEDWLIKKKIEEEKQAEKRRKEDVEKNSQKREN